MNVLDSIQGCQKVRRCWGDLNPQAYGPAVLSCRQRHPKVMVVTEQPNLKREETARHWNPTELLIDYLRETKQWRSAEVANRIDQMFGGAFLRDFDEESSSFNEFYWAHFIKCPGKIRSRKDFNTRGLLADACADRWLLHEISQLKPKLIVSFGSKAGTWILPKIGYKEKWTERIWEEFR